jgi:aminoglycoside 3-N-acetyltransferase
MESEVIARTARPATVDSLAGGLRELGVEPGMVLLVHSSLSGLGWVAGGAQAVVLALQEVVGPEGTVVMPTHSYLTDPATWDDPPVPEGWWPVIRQHLPAFDPALTPTRGMGAIVECFRRAPGVRRSGHPSVSFAAWGRHSQRVVADHALDDDLGEGSPLARVYELDGQVLLLGVGHDNNTSLHLAEYRAEFPGRRWEGQGSPVLVDGVRRWVRYRNLVGDASDFERIGQDFSAETGLEGRGPVGETEARLMGQRAVVDYAVTWMEQHRTGSVPGGAVGRPPRHER